MIILRSILLLATVACLGFLGYTLATVGAPAPVLDELQRLIGSPWVQVLLASYYLGVLCCVAAIVVIERRPAVMVPWLVAGLLVTYPALVFWLLLRGLPEMGERSSRRLRTLG